MRITSISSSMVSVPYSIPTTWAKGTGSRTFNLIIRVETDEGLVGWGESVGPSVHNARNLIQRELAPLLTGVDPRNLTAIRRKIELALDYLPGAHWAYSGLEMAFLDIKGKSVNLSASDLLGGRLVDSIEYIGYIFIDSPEVNAEQAKRFTQAGHGTLKMKLGRDIGIDEARLRAVRDAVGPEIRIRIDSNTAWNREEALRNLDRLYHYNIEYAEQPLSRWDIQGLADLRLRSRIPIAADESCGTFRDAVNLIDAGACDVLVVYVSQAGGMLEAKRIADFAADKGIRCVMGSASELGLATLAQAHVIASSPGFQGAADTHLYLEQGDVLDEELALTNGSLRLPDGPGLGASVSERKLRDFPVPDDTHAYSLYDQ